MPPVPKAITYMAGKIKPGLIVSGEEPLTINANQTIERKKEIDI